MALALVLIEKGIIDECGFPPEPFTAGRLSDAALPGKKCGENKNKLDAFGNCL